MKNWMNTILGIAYGDAWGYTVEFQPYEKITATDPRGPELPGVLAVSDDTQMTLYLARALDGVVGLYDSSEIRSAIIDAYLTWMNDPDNFRAPGVTCMTSLGKIADGEPWQEATSLVSDGCGANMRVAPAAFLPDDLWAPVAAFQAAVTHGSRTGIASALLTAYVIRAAANGKLKPGHVLEFALNAAIKAANTTSGGPMCAGVGPWLKGLPGLEGSGNKDVAAFLAPGFHACASALKGALMGLDALQEDTWAVDPCVFGGEGWRGHEALATALLCVDALPGKPVEALRRAAVTGGDSDSIAAIAGAILGALYDDPWPGEWLGRLEDRYADEISDAVDCEFDMMPSLDPVTHAVRPWSGETWTNDDGTLAARPGTYCAEDGSHHFVSAVCSNCGLTY